MKRAATLPPEQTIILTGFMGVGKTTNGRLLAKQSGREFVDLDTMIEARLGRSIATIFADEGEDAFRRYELETLRDALATVPPNGLVLATGGGCLLAPEAAAAARAAGVVVCLAAPPQLVLGRVSKAGAARRPLWSNDVETVRRRLAERAAAYARAADVVIDVGLGSGSSSEVVAQIMSALQHLPERRSIRIAAAAGDYDVAIGYGLLAEAGLRVSELVSGRRALIVTDENVAEHYLDQAERSFQAAGFVTGRAVVPVGESSKTVDYAQQLYDAAVQVGLDRNCPIIALGGGVVGDLAGFVAGTFLRGVPFIQIPTSLLAQIDASVGGKTGVNHAAGKNLIGVFHPPRLVVCDLDVLDTLPQREWQAGLAEAVKHGLLADADYFRWLEEAATELRRRDAGVRRNLVMRSVEIKAAVVTADEREHGPRMALNLGHTIGHAIEAALGYGQWLHGEAVAAGLVAAADLAMRLDLTSADDVRRIKELLTALGLPTRLPKGLIAQQVLQAAGTDKKRVDRQLRWVLPNGIGRVVIRDDVPEQSVLEVLSLLATT